MFNHLLPSASSYSGEVDQLFWLITVIVGVYPQLVARVGELAF